MDSPQEVIVACSKCGQKNRIRERAGYGIYKCGKCGAIIKNPFLYVIFDCETTGLPSQRSVPYMVQLAWGVYEANGTLLKNTVI